LKGGFLSIIIAGLSPLLILFLIVVVAGIPLVEWQPPLVWTSSFGTSPFPNGVTGVSAGTAGVFAGGFVGYDDTGRFNPSPSGLFLREYSLDGQQIWNRYIGNADDHVKSIVTNRDAVYVAGSLNLTGIVRRYDFGGNQIWSVSIGHEVDSISVSSSEVYAAGFSYTNSTYSLFVRDYDLNGNMSWTVSLFNFTQLSPGPLNVYSGSNRVYVAGSETSGSAGFLRSYYFNGTLEWSQDSICNCLPSGISADASGLYVTGYAYQGAVATAFLDKYDSNGNQIWTKNINPLDLTTVAILQMSVGPSGIYLAMTTIRSGYLLRYDSNGNQVWSFNLHKAPGTVSVGQNGVYLGGQDFYKEVSGNAFVSEFSQSSSLIFFGLNPPYSFITVGALVTGVGFTVWWLWRRAKRRPPRPKSTAPYGSPKPQADEPMWRRRPA